MKNQDTQAEFEEPPGHRRPPHSWEDVFPPPKEVAGLSPSGLFCVDITSFAKLMASDELNCLIRRQTVPIARKLVPFETQTVNNLVEDTHCPASSLVLYRCPPQVLMSATAQCAADSMLPDSDALLQWILKSLPKRPQAIPHNGPQREIHVPAILNMEGKQ